MINGKLQLRSNVDDKIIITDLKPLTNDELEQMCLKWFNELMALSFSVDISELDNDKVGHYQDVIKDGGGVQYHFEPCSPDEPIGEIYKEGKLIGFIM